MDLFDERPAVAEGTQNPHTGGFGDGSDGDAAAAAETFDHLSVDQMLVHPNWKARRDGLEIVFKTGTEDSNVRATFVENLPKLCKDSNTAVLEQVFETASTLLDHGTITDSQVKDFANLLLKPVLDKGITGRPKAAQASLSFLSSMISNAQHEEVVHALVASFAHKTPKNRQMALAACAGIVKDFGLTHLPTKVILKAVSPLFGDANALVRKEAQHVFCECYRYLGTGIKAFLGDLREVQVEEMMKTFEDLQVGVAPEKTIKGLAVPAASAQGRPVVALTNGDAYNNHGGDMDDATFTLLDEAVVVGKLPKNFFSVAMDKALKWQDRCAMVSDGLVPLLKAKKFRLQDDYHELCKCIKELFVDPQAPLMLIAIQCFQQLAQGLRHNMAPYARPFIGPIFEKMKDKKTSVLEHMLQTLMILLRCRCLSLESLQEEMDVVSCSKVPNQRLALISFINRCLDMLDKNECQRFVRTTTLLIRFINDEKVEVREAAIQLVCRLTSLYGDKMMQGVLSALDAKQLSKVLGTHGSVDATHSVASLGGGLPSVRSTNAVAQQFEASPCSPPKKVHRPERHGGVGGGMVKALSASSLNQQPRRDIHGAPPPRASPASSSQADSKPSTATSSPCGGVGAEDAPQQQQHSSEGGLPTLEVAHAKIKALLSEEDNCLESLSSKDWKARVDALAHLHQIAQDTWADDVCTEMMDYVVVVLKAEAVWKDAIFQVVNQVLTLLLELLKRATSLSPRTANVMVSAVAPRFVEPKSKPLARELVFTIAECVTPRLVTKMLFALAQAQKSPKLTQEICDFSAQLLLDFDSAQVDVRAVIEFVKMYCFEQSQPFVKQAGVQLLGALRRKVGSARVDPHLADVNVHLKSVVDAEFSKAAQSQDEAVPTTSRQLKPLAAAAAQEPPLSAKAQVARHGATKTNGRGGLTAAGGQQRLRNEEESVVAAPVMAPSSSHGSSGGGNNEQSFRVDVSQQLIAACKEVTGGADWKARAAAIKRVEDAVLGAQKRIQGYGVPEIIRALGARFTDSNKNVVVDALRVLSLVLESAEPQASKVGVKVVLPSALSLLGDQKLNLREEAAKVCSLGVRVLGVDAAIPMLLKPLSSDAPSSRQISVSILDKTLSEMTTADGGTTAASASASSSPATTESHAALHFSASSRASLSHMVPVLLRLLMDRSADVRASADRIVGVLFPVVGPEVFHKAAVELKPAEQQVIRPFLEKRIVAAAAPPQAVAATAPSGPSAFHRIHGGARLGIPSLAGDANAIGAAGTGINDATASTAAAPKRAIGGHRDPQAPAPPHHQQQHHHPLAGLGAGRGVGTTDHSIATLDVVLQADDIVLGLRSASHEVALKMCGDFMRRFRKGEDCGSVDMMQAMIDRLQSNMVHFDADLVSGLIGCLNAIFSSPRASLRNTAASLVPMFRAVFSCLLSEQFAQSDTVIRSLNSMTLKMLEGCAVNEVFGALMALMAEYSTVYLESNSKLDHKYVQIVVKCLMRLETDTVSPEAVILCCHDYLLQHPPSAFRSRDDLSIRTIKTILQAVSRKHGKELLATADALVGPQNLVSHFIRACIESKEKLLRSRQEQPPQAQDAPHEQPQHSHADLGPRDVEEPNASARVAEELPAASRGFGGTVATTNSTPAAPGDRSAPEAVFTALTASATAPSNPVAPPLSAPAVAAAATSEGSTLSTRPVTIAPAAGPSPAVVAAASASPAAYGVPTLGNVAPNVHASATFRDDAKPIALIFTKIRNHVTSNQGVEELYVYLKQSPDCQEFVQQYNKCSDAFRSYIKRRLEKVCSEDTAKPAEFAFPLVVRQTP